MFNFLDHIRDNPEYYVQLSVDDQLITQYQCPLEHPKTGIWSHQNYIAYVIEGKKVWHVPGRSVELTAGRCIFVKKGAQIVEQFFDTRFCVVIFFLTDEFILSTINASVPQNRVFKRHGDISPLTEIHADDTIHAFFHSIIPYFNKSRAVNKNLLELKFRELLLNVILHPRNLHLTEYFYSLHTDSSFECLLRVMEENYCFNLKLEAYARLCGKSLSSFKRCFMEHLNITPGRWLLNKRLQKSQLLLQTTTRSVSEIAFECGFENVSHFSRAFKQQFGNTPVQARSVANA